MKRKDLSPLLKIFDTTLNDSGDKDLSMPCKISVYEAIGNASLVYGEKLFDFQYIPLVEKQIMNKLMYEYDNSKVLSDLYRLIQFLYITNLEQTYKWYYEHLNDLTFDKLQKELQSYSELKIKGFGCPLLNYLDPNTLLNKNIIKNIKAIVNHSELNEIDSINVLLYGTDNINFQKREMTDLGKILHNSVLNTIFYRFEEFLNSELEKKRNTTESKNDNKPTGETKPPDFEPKLFKDLFDKPEIIDECLNLLRETDKPCISEHNKFMRNKGAFIIWFNALEKNKIFGFSFRNDIERAKTLNFNFEGLNVSSSLFRQENVKATEKHKKNFEGKINTIKH